MVLNWESTVFTLGLSWQCLKKSGVVTSGVVLLPSSEQRPETLLNRSQAAKNYPVRNVNSAKTEKERTERTTSMDTTDLLHSIK